MQCKPGILVIIASIYLMQSSAAWACFCTGGEVRLIPAYNATAAVFVGTVTLLRKTVASGRSADSEKILIAHLSVDEAFKGVATQDVVVMTDANSSGGCGFYFEVGKQYLVFANAAPSNAELQIGLAKGVYVPTPIPMRGPTLTTGACGNSGPMSYARRAAAMIRNYVRGTPRPQIDGLVGVYGHELDESSATRFHGLRDLAVIATSNGQRFETRTDELGSFLFENLPPGTYTVGAQLPAPYPPAVETVELESNEQRAELRLFARPTARLRGRLLDSTGKPLETSVALSLIPLTERSGQQSSTDGLTSFFSAGVFEFREVPPGKYILGVSPFVPTPNAPYPRAYYPRGDSVQAATIFDVGLGVIDNLIFKLPPQLDTRPIAGVVVAADGAPISDAQVLLYDVEMPLRLAAAVRLTDGAGRFSVFGLQGRRYRLQARKFTDFSESRGIQSQPIEVAVGEASQEVRLLVDQEAVLQIRLK